MTAGGTLRFRAGQAAEAVAEQDLPAEPGGGLWCDVPRGAGGIPWAGRLHPLTASSLASSRRHVATAQSGYVHIRIEAVDRGGAPGGTPAPATPRRPRDGGPVRRQALDVVLGDGFALTAGVTAAAAADAVWDDYATGRRRADGPIFAVYQALAAVVEDYGRESQTLLARAESVTQRLVRLSERNILAEIVSVRRQAMDLRDIVGPAVDALRLLARAPAVPGEVRPYFVDLCRRVEEVQGGIEGTRETMGEAVEAYTSVQSTHMNRVMQTFTVVAVLFGPPTLIASIYGMNFHIPEYHWPLGYPYALGLMLAVSFGLVIYLRRSGSL